MLRCVDWRRFEGPECLYCQCHDYPRTSLGHVFIFSLKHSPWTFRDPADDSTKSFENSVTIRKSKRRNIPEDLNRRQHRFSKFVPRKLQLTLGMSPCVLILLTLTCKAVLFFVFMQRRIAETHLSF
jgi:hypothetical protein